MKRHPAACDRARLWASLAVDSEISELERALLRAHVAACPSCRHYAREIAGISERLRSAPVRRPARPVWRHSRGRSAGVRPWQLAASAAAVAAALLVGGLTGRLTSSGRSSDTDASIAASWMFYTAYRSAPETALLVRRRSIPS